MLGRVLVLLIAALSLGPSFAHVLEAPPRLMVWSPELWREATVFNGQFRFFALIGAPLDVLAVLAPALMAWANRDDRLLCRRAAVGTSCSAAALLCWFAVVAPMNGVLARWTPGPIPVDFVAVRNRWEAGHILVAFLKLAGLTAIMLALVRPRSDRTIIPD